jgi:hypothetical protein
MWLKSITSTNDFNTVGKSSPSANMAVLDERLTLVTSAGTSVILSNKNTAKNGKTLPAVSEDSV